MEIKDELIYVATPFGGKAKNYRFTKKLIKKLTKCHPNLCFVSPILAFGHMYNDMPYEDGMRLCYTLLDVCTSIWIFGGSKGVSLEREFAQKYNITIREL